jgi:hypothetical protein
MIFWREIVAQQADRAQVDLATFDHRKHHREPPSDTRRRQPMKRLALAQAEPLHAVFELRRTSVFRVKPSLFDLRDVRNDPCLGATAACQQRREPTPQLLVRDTAQFPECPCFHGQMLTRTLLTSCAPLQIVNAGQDES